MEEQLYLFEVLIDEINFEDVSGEIPTKKQLIITVSLGSIATLEIRSETLPLKGGEGSNKRHIDFKCGKSYLCFFSPDNLLDALERKSIEVVVGIKGDVQPICSTTIPWNDGFRDLIAESKDVIGLLTPATVTENCILMNNEIKKGNLLLFMRLSCFGTSLQTQFEINLESGNKQYIFKSPYMMTTFTCGRYGTGDSSDFLPVSPMYTITSHRGDAQDKTTPSDQSVSWTALPKSFHPDSSYRSSTQSECLFPEYLNIPPAKTSTLTFDIVSLIDRPEEDKFIDFNTGRRISDPQDKRYSITHSDDSEGKETIIYFTDSRPVATVERKVGIETSVSAEKLAKSCQCPNTPLVCKHVLDAIKRFEKSHPDLMLYGKKVKYDKILGAPNDEKDDSILRLRGGNDKEDLPPFKHKKGKGCYNKKCKMAKKLRSVGVSQLKELTNEPMDSKRSSFCVNILCPENEKQNIAIQVSFSKEEIPFSFDCKNRHCPAAKLLKNFGLGPLAIEKCQGTIYGPVTPPIQYGISQTYGIFDTYGPFGIFSTTDTPFVPHYDEQVDTTECFEYNCKSRNPKAKGEKFVCEECAKKSSRYQIDTTFSSEISFPNSRDVLRLRGGGGAPESIDVVPNGLRTGEPSKSPIAECQEVMEQFDKILEEYRNALGSGSQDVYNRLEEFMPFSMAGSCGHARCTYISEPILPPIHWDCPEPLPEGFCENPDCPYLPQDLKRIGRILAAKRHHNRSSECHCNEIPQCFNTDIELNTLKQNCPFSNHPKIVNMMQFGSSFAYQEYDSMPNCYNSKLPDLNYYSSLVEDVSAPCSNPDCPLKHQENIQSCSNPKCPSKQPKDTNSCSNPDCPLKKPGTTNSCSNPDCPFKQRGSTNSCSNPDCPFKQRDSTNSCSNPDCPLKERESTNSCSNPDCPFKQRESTNSCSNPDCPLKQQGSANSCSNPDCPSKRNKKPELCANPACPFNDSSIQESYSQVDCSPKQGKLSKQCSNPNCPFRQISADSCLNPECPLKMEILSSMETFGTLECALKLRNQTMPKEDGDKLETCNAASASQCTVSECLIHKQSCSNPDCPLKKEKMQICGNPECPYKSEEVPKRKGICGPSSQSICGDHTCPFQVDADGDKKRDKQDQLFSGSKDGGGDKEQSEEQTVARTYLRDEDFEEGSPIMTRGDRPSHYDMAPCRTKTCEFLGGKLTCVECATATKKKKINIKVCSGEAKCPAHTRHIIRTRKPKPPDLSKRALKKERNKFMYHFGDTYPGTHVGHKECLITPFNVPAKMGWLWNVHTPCLRLKRRNGWRPGLIGKTILEVIQAHRKAQHMAMLEQGKKKRKNKFGFVESEMEIVYPKPTLQIKKRDGVYYITMNPLKDPRTLVNNENPYMECTPMQFKIIKNKEHNEFKSCICNDQGILYEPSSSSDSELDLEFTPPAGVIRPERFLKPRDVIHIDTQYNAKDFAEKPKVDLERGSSEQKSIKKGKKNKKKKGKKKK